MPGTRQLGATRQQTCEALNADRTNTNY